MSNNCRLAGLHQFEPRYDLVMPSVMDSFFHSLSGDADGLRNKIYVLDICVRCGAQQYRDPARQTGEQT